jgi:hypothetical protein
MGHTLLILNNLLLQRSINAFLKNLYMLKIVMLCNNIIKCYFEEKDINKPNKSYIGLSPNHMNAKPNRLRSYLVSLLSNIVNKMANIRFPKPAKTSAPTHKLEKIYAKNMIIKAQYFNPQPYNKTVLASALLLAL